MAQIPVSIAVSPSGTTLLAAQQVTNTAATVVFNEVVTLGDAGSGNVGSVLASGAQLIEPGGVNTQPVSGTFFPATQTVTGTVAITSTSTQTITAVQPTATNLSMTAVQPTAANLNATVVGTVTANAGTGTLAVSAASLPLGLGAGTIGYGQLVVTSATGGTSIVAARATRKALAITVLTNAATSIYWGDVNVSQTSGFPILIGQAQSIPTVAAVYGIANGTTTSANIAYVELYG